MRKLQPRPIEIVNRADSFSECALKPSCVKITIRHSGILVQGEVANDEDGLMLIRLGYDIQFDIPSSGSMVAMLNVHPSRLADLRELDEVCAEPDVEVTSLINSFGICCTRSSRHRDCCG
jgi:hypothetical protein